MKEVHVESQTQLEEEKVDTKSLCEMYDVCDLSRRG